MAFYLHQRIFHVALVLLVVLSYVLQRFFEVFELHETLNLLLVHLVFRATSDVCSMLLVKALSPLILNILKFLLGLAGHLGQLIPYLQWDLNIILI